MVKFTTYEEKPVNPCDDVNGTFYTSGQRTQCLNTTDYLDINVGFIYNDVWAYRLCPIAKTASQDGSHHRFFDAPCISEGWVVWHTGAREGGCYIELGVTVSILYHITDSLFVSILILIFDIISC